MIMTVLLSLSCLEACGRQGQHTYVKTFQEYLLITMSEITKELYKFVE